MTSVSGVASPSIDLDAWLGAAWVSAEVHALRPDYTAVLIAADGLRPGPSDAESDAMLDAARQRAGAHLAGAHPPGAHPAGAHPAGAHPVGAGAPPEELPHLAQWREAFRAFGAKPQRTRPSVEALLRRLDGLPRIDRITDAYNAVSIAHLLPVGGEDLARYTGPARLVRAAGDEDFDTMADGQPAVEHPEPGEVIWRDDGGVTCRRWNWRQCVRTRITAATTTAVFILDGLGALGTGGLRDAEAELTEALARLSPGARFASRLISATA